MELHEINFIRHTTITKAAYKIKIFTTEEINSKYKQPSENKNKNIDKFSAQEQEREGNMISSPFKYIHKYIYLNKYIYIYIFGLFNRYLKYIYT